MKKVWHISSILQFQEGVTFSMPRGLGHILHALPDHGDLWKVSHVIFRVLKVAMTHHNFVLCPVMWVQPKVDACLHGHNSRESA